MVILAAGLFVAACDDPFEERANTPNIDIGFDAWAMTGAPPHYPSALIVPIHTVVRPDAAGSFDIAFDIDSTGRLVVLPMTQVVSPVTGPRQIGLMSADVAYGAVVEAPLAGWVYDSTIIVNPGGVFLVKAQSVFCQFNYRQDIHAKFYVDSVVPEERRIKLAMRVNPNCGFRSLLTGLPEY